MSYGSESRKHYAIRLAAIQRIAMCNTLSGVLPLYIVTEYPKSGGTWVAQMLAEYLNVPFPRNQRPRLETCVMHGHYRHSPLFRNVVCVLRDGRDVMVSAYFHRLVKNDRTANWMIAKNRRALPFDDYDDVRMNLPRFIEHQFVGAARGWTKFSWADFVKSWHGRDVPLVRYEELLKDAAGELGRAVDEICGEADLERLREIAEKYSFEKQVMRKAGVEDRASFLRKGVAGDWRGKFTRAAAETFDRYAGEELVKLGYEPDRSWVLDQPEG